MDELTQSPDFWIKLWQEAKSKQPTACRHRRNHREMVESWNKRAGQFAERANSTRRKKRQQAEIKKLTEAGALEAGHAILDIGAGPGNYAVSMARKCRHVTAVEPAGEMLRFLKNNMEEAAIDNITVIQETWQEIDIEKEGLCGRFDLVFAAMSPGIEDHTTLDKMIEASRGFCYLSTFSGPRWGQPHIDLWRRFFDENIGSTPNDIIYPFGYLYASGYYPSLDFLTVKQDNQEPVDKAVENLENFFWKYMDLTPAVKDAIRKYVKNCADNGVFKYQTIVRHGMMLWNCNA